ncbi:hypothetical protein NFI96_002290 [Prochilodus magdalenae]|nr:hypothetical protein NFI96_002290 [Prochilodus magdalenae]
MSLSGVSLMMPEQLAMGGGQSADSPADQRQRNEEHPSSQGNEAPASQSLDTESGSRPLEAGSELPQRRLGSRKVDDMSFMITCTNCSIIIPVQVKGESKTKICWRLATVPPVLLGDTVVGTQFGGPQTVARLERMGGKGLGAWKDMDSTTSRLPSPQVLRHSQQALVM